MELLIKIVITAAIIFTAGKILHWTWTSHIDPNNLYQNGLIVADIIGSVKIDNDIIYFSQIANVSVLDRSQPIEYKRFKLQIIQVQSVIDMKSVVTNEGSKVLQNVMEGITCKKLE